MKTRLNKILTVITAVTFVAALTLNIQASLNDPFAGMSDEAVALTTSDCDTTRIEVGDACLTDEELCCMWVLPDGTIDYICDGIFEDGSTISYL